MPDATQAILLAKHFGCVRFVYNHFLNERIAQYKKTKQSDNYHAQALALTQLKKKEDRIWLKEVNSQTLQFALKALDIAFVNFFKNRSEFARFKSKRHKNIFTVPQSGRIDDDRIRMTMFK